MREKDILEKKLEDFCEVFADIVNVLLFNGDKKVSPAEIKDSATKSSYKADGRYHSQDRDVAKYWEIDGKRITMFGLENQTGVEKYMPFRILSYDGAEYRRQLSEISSAKRKKKPIPGVYPVISIVLYFGNKRWNEPKTLKDCVDYPGYLEPYIADYPLNIFEIAFLPDETVELFESDFRFVAQLFTQQRKYDDGLTGRIVFSPENLVHVHEVLDLLDAMLGSDNGFLRVYNDMEERTSDMNEIFRAIQQTQYDKGQREGHREGQFEATMSYYQKGYLPAGVAAEELSMTEEQFLEAHEKWLATKQEAVLV